MRKRICLPIIIAAALVAATGGISLWLTNGHSHKPDDAYTLLRQGIDESNDSVAQALGHLQQAAAIFKQQKDSDRLFEAAVYTAMLYDQIGQRDRAYSILKEMDFRDVPNYRDYSSQYYLRLMGHYKAAIDHDYKAAELFTLHAIRFSKDKYPGDAAYMYVDLANLAEIFITSGQSERARLLLDSLESLEPVKYQLYLSEVHLCRGLMEYADGQIDSAAIHFEASREYSHRYSAFDNELHALYMLAKIDSVNNWLHSYIAHKQAYDSLRKRIKGNEIHYQVAMMREQHKLDLIRQENEKSSTIYRLTLCVMFLVIVTILSIAIYIYKNGKNKQRVAKLEEQRLNDTVELERLEKELLQLKMQQQGEMLDRTQKENLVMSMKLVEQGCDTDSIAPMDRMIKEMDREFIKKVTAKCPKLSNNDVRLMSLIKQGLSSGDISKMLNIATESLHKSRYRLRKKLGLTAGQSLEDFINSI